MSREYYFIFYFQVTIAIVQEKSKDSQPNTPPPTIRIFWGSAMSSSNQGLRCSIYSIQLTNKLKKIARKPKGKKSAPGGENHPSFVGCGEVQSPY
jgi:hypothetical protein